MNAKETQTKIFYKGLGRADAKSGVNNLIELKALISKYPKFYQENDLVWVVSEKSFYTIDAIVADVLPTYTKYELSAGPELSGEDVTMFFGAQNTIHYFQQGDPAYKPSLKGYSNGDALIASRSVGVINRLDIYEVSIPEVGNESYIYAGSMLGTKGEDGADGVGLVGEKGDAMRIDAQGPLADRDTGAIPYASGYSYLATDTGNLYFKESEAGEEPLVWSEPIPFGKGDSGSTTYFVFKRAVTQPATPAIDDVNVPSDWYDSPPVASISTEKLWMSKAIYAVNAGGVPTTTVVWSTPIQMDGADGMDGTEGKDAGFWVMWSNADSPNKVGLPKPVNYTLDLSTEDDWYDDVAADDAPIWMAQCLYNSLTSSWGDWKFSKIGGEKPPYKLNLFTRSTSVPATPTGAVPYTQADGKFSTGAQAAAANAGWTDTPTTTGDPLYMTEIQVNYGGTNTNWSTPVRIDGVEGVSAGIWTIWSSADLTAKPAAPSPVGGIISIDGASLDLSASPSWKDDVDELDASPNWMATSYYRPKAGGGHEWTTWAVLQIKGESGEAGAGSEGTARTYIPLTMFARGDSDAIANLNITALALSGDDATGYTVIGEGINSGSPATINITSLTPNIQFTDGIPEKTASAPNNSDRIWMIQTVLNSVDNIGYSNKGTWTSPVLLADNNRIDYQYHDGIGSLHTLPAGTPDLEDSGWYDTPTDDTYWIASKNYSEGAGAAWKIYKIRGEDGVDGSSAEDLKVYTPFSIKGLGIDPITEHTPKRFALANEATTDNKNDGFKFLSRCRWYHDGVENGDPSVGDRVFETADNTIPVNGYNQWYTLGKYDYDVIAYVPVLYIKVSTVGKIMEIKDYDEILASVPAIFTGMHEIKLSSYKNKITSTTFQSINKVIMVSACLTPKRSFVWEGKNFFTGTEITVPFQSNAENDDIRGVQVQVSNSSYGGGTVTISANSFKLMTTSASSGNNGHWIDEDDWYLIVRLYS